MTTARRRLRLGSLSLHAAEHFGRKVVGVTIAAEQKRFIDARIAERGLADRVEIRLQDYRDVPERALRRRRLDRDGRARRPGQLPDVRRRAAPVGASPAAGCSSSRCRARGKHPGGGPFIESFIAPDMHMRPVGETVALLEDGGLEVRDVHALREHYVRTVAGWLDDTSRPTATASSRWSARRSSRVWRLYLVGGAHGLPRRADGRRPDPRRPARAPPLDTA